MDAEIAARRAKLLIRVSAILVGALGLYIICIVVIPLKTLFLEWKWSSLFFLLAFPIPAVIYGGYCLFAACKSWSIVSAENVRRIAIVAAVLFGVLLVGAIWRPEDNGWRRHLTPIMIIAAGGIFYVLCSRSLLKWLGLHDDIDWNRREKAIRRFFWLLAFFVFSASSRFVAELSPRAPGFPLWSAVTLLGSLLVAVVLYHVCIRVALRNKPVSPIDHGAAMDQSQS